MNDPGITLNIPSDNQDDDVAIPNALQTPTTPQSAVTPAKRYRSTPAKTFQCTGFGDCRMVFSRSEHLARHIRSAFSVSMLSLQPVVNLHPVLCPSVRG
jgi:hypothetical protein